MYFKEGIKAIIKSKIFSLIIIIQLVIAFLTLIASVNMIQGSLSQLIKFRSTIGEKSTIKISYSSINKDNVLNDNDAQKIFEYYEELLRDENISKIGIMSTSGTEGVIQDLNSISNGKKSGFSNTIFTDENFYNYIGNIRLISGRNFSKEDFSKGGNDIVPIIISGDLKEYLSLGEVFNGKYKVIGVLKDNNNLFYNNNGNLYLGVTQKENTIIIPVNYKDKANKIWVTNSFMNNTIITLNNKNLINKYIKKISSDLATICPAPLKVTNVIDERVDFINLIKGGIMASVSMSALLIIYSFFGIMSIILTSLIRRKKEFGVKLSIGWTVKDICLQVVSEIFMIVIFSYIVSIGLSLILLKNEMFGLNIYTYGIVLLLVLLFTITYSILPISKIKKMNIVELIKDVR
ncbi:ABC transporter permease [Clostridium sp. FP2]|uniref:ABC transporter permease n=1 Tax=Clostridium TaxID=1485 RepID=UPI0013E90A7E|nr:MULTISPECIES: ABC transporter permease [Clostridium]MBW9155154.1 ABC transporter permease [Clostridium tagluense]MBZ9624781.1 ABC transporter permease [Clostridium sp. FP2]WLC64591.1 ABC transporter permease [Clostridium tagluense]